MSEIILKESPIVELVGEPKDIKKVEIEERTVKYDNVTITYRDKNRYMIKVHGTGNPTAFTLYASPTTNCQIASASMFYTVLHCVFYNEYYKDNQRVQVTMQERSDKFKRIIREIRHAITTSIGSREFKMWLIDIKQVYAGYLDKPYIDIPKDCYVFKNDYKSTNGSDMQMSLINMIKLVNYWENEENKKVQGVAGSL